MGDVTASVDDLLLQLASLGGTIRYATNISRGIPVTVSKLVMLKLVRGFNYTRHYSASKITPPITVSNSVMYEGVRDAIVQHMDSSYDSWRRYDVKKSKSHRSGHQSTTAPVVTVNVPMTCVNDDTALQKGLLLLQLVFQSTENERGMLFVEVASNRRISPVAVSVP